MEVNAQVNARQKKVTQLVAMKALELANPRILNTLHPVTPFMVSPTHDQTSSIYTRPHHCFNSHQTSFQEVKRSVSSAPLLSLPNTRLDPYRVGPRLPDGAQQISGDFVRAFQQNSIQIREIHIYVQ